MQLVDSQAVQTCDPRFARRVEEMSGANLGRCYQCLTCTLGCPVAFAMDYQPHQLLRMVQLGLKQQVLSSSTIWLCAGCEACATRCPNDIEIVTVMDALRQIALQEGVKAKEGALVTFHRTFLEGVQRWGRQYELGLMLMLKLRTRDLFSDINLGFKFLYRGKLAFRPRRTRGAKEVNDLFEKTERGRK